MTYAEKIQISPEHPERAAVVRCIRIAMERSFIERGRKDPHWRYAYQVGRDIAALHGIEFDSLRFDDLEQNRIRKLYWPEQQASAEDAAHPELAERKGNS